MLRGKLPYWGYSTKCLVVMTKNTPLRMLLSISLPITVKYHHCTVWLRFAAQGPIAGTGTQESNNLSRRPMKTSCFRSIRPRLYRTRKLGCRTRCTKRCTSVEEHVPKPDDRKPVVSGIAGLSVYSAKKSGCRSFARNGVQQSKNPVTADERQLLPVTFGQVSTPQGSQDAGSIALAPKSRTRIK